METQTNEEENQSTSESGNGVSDYILDVYDTAMDEASLAVTETETIEVEERFEHDHVFTDDELRLIMQLVVAEAENQPVEGQQLVVDVVLNRLANEKFPNSVSEIIYQPGQFECVTNGRFASCADRIAEDVCCLVEDEIYFEQHNLEVLYFKTGGYFGFANPVCQVGDHYFSGE
jgi:N-acetylmuramoyl-L-alanine amidase